MFEIKGKYTTALITTDNIEEEAISQITELINHPAAQGSKVVIMPDVHAGKGCVIGTTMTITDRIVPNLVGVDIGCGVLAVKVPNVIDFAKLDKVIRDYIPYGTSAHKEQKIRVMDEKLSKLVTPLSSSQMQHIKNSLGSLGSGNHFISVEADGDYTYLIIHSGSRNLGVQVAKYHQNIAEKQLKSTDKSAIIEQLKQQGRQSEIQTVLSTIDKPEGSKDLAYLQGKAMEDYLHDVEIAQDYAHFNRLTMALTIARHMGWTFDFSSIESVHNYIDTKEMILRKGAISANGRFLVPLNMKDGTLICIGEYNEEWNFSAPHGAGRAMSRSKAKELLDVNDFKEEMNGIWSSTVGKGTLDEAPKAYKPADEIKEIISQQYTVWKHLKPLYNFKASDGEE